MKPVQPALHPAYFSLQKQTQLPHSQFFLSWEDALWHLLNEHEIPSGATVLVPSFFCWDVVENMAAHGLRAAVYEIEKDLQPNREHFIKLLRTERPHIVVIFHAVGITNTLFTNTEDWLRYLSKETVLIEDCVHKILEPEKISFITPNHYLLDSLRKVVPVQGNWLYSNHPVRAVSTETRMRTLWYRWQVVFWWICMQLFLVAAYYCPLSQLQTALNVLAEKTMLWGYDVIGDHILASPGSAGMKELSHHLSFNTIKTAKKSQVAVYNQCTEKLYTKKWFFKIPFAQSDAGELRGYPVGITARYAEECLAQLRAAGLLVRFELNDSPWSEQQKVIYLPLGPLYTANDCQAVCQVLESVSL